MSSDGLLLKWKDGAVVIYRAMGVTLSVRLLKDLPYKPSWTGCHFVSWIQQEDFICALMVVPWFSCDNRSWYSVYFLDKTVFPEASHIKLYKLMSVRGRENSVCTLVEVILHYQSEKQSNHRNFTLTCDSCNCGSPHHGRQLVSVFLWQRKRLLSLCLTLALCMSFSFSVFPSDSPSLSNSTFLWLDCTLTSSFWVC